jgi:hypothetical protein
MNNNKFATSLVTIATAAALLTSLIALPASAQSIAVNTGVSASSTKGADRLPKIIAKSDTAITKRLTSLATLNTKVQALKNVSATEKTNISNNIQTNISGLTSLKAKIDADTDVTVAATDAKTITGSYRIYALVIPQGYIASSADRVDTIDGLMTTLSAKLQSRITAAQSAGKNVTSLQASLTDLNAKVADSNTQAATAQSGVASLTPDQGNKTVLASNTAALKASRADIKTASADLKTARQDAKTIVDGVKSDGVTVSATTSVTQ